MHSVLQGGCRLLVLRVHGVQPTLALTYKLKVVKYSQVFVFSEQPIALPCKNALTILRVLVLRTARNSFDFPPISTYAVVDIKQVWLLYTIPANSVICGVCMNILLPGFYL